MTMGPPPWLIGPFCVYLAIFLALWIQSLFEKKRSSLKQIVYLHILPNTKQNNLLPQSSFIKAWIIMNRIPCIIKKSWSNIEPYIILNDQKVSGQAIIPFLKQKFGIDIDIHLKSHQRSEINLSNFYRHVFPYLIAKKYSSIPFDPFPTMFSRLIYFPAVSKLFSLGCSSLGHESLAREILSPYIHHIENAPSKGSGFYFGGNFPTTMDALLYSVFADSSSKMIPPEFIQSYVTFMKKTIFGPYHPSNTEYFIGGIQTNEMKFHQSVFVSPL